MRKPTFFLATLLSSFPLFSQIYTKLVEPELWMNNRLVRDCGSEIKIESQRKEECKVITKQGEFTKKYDVFGNRFWTTVKREEAGNKARLIVFSSQDADHWREEGSLSITPDERPIHIWPIQNDRFLAMYAWQIERDKMSSPFALLKRGEDGALKIESLLDWGLKAKLRHKDADGTWYFSPDVLHLTWQWGLEYARTPSALVIYSSLGGYFWSVDTDQEQIDLKTRVLYPAVKDFLYGPKAQFLEAPVLEVQPCQDGHLLIAARSEDAVFKARELEAKMQFRAIPDPSKPTPVKFDDQSKEAVRRQGLIAYPELLWWDLDPSSMSFKHLDAPYGAPIHFTSLEQFRNFAFRHKVDGSIVFPN